MFSFGQTVGVYIYKIPVLVYKAKEPGRDAVLL